MFALIALVFILAVGGVLAINRYRRQVRPSWYREFNQKPSYSIPKDIPQCKETSGNCQRIPYRKVLIEDNEAGNVSETESVPLKCRFIRNIEVSESEETIEPEVKKGEEIYVAHERYYPGHGREGVEVLRVRHKRTDHVKGWRDVEVTASVLNHNTVFGY